MSSNSFGFNLGLGKDPLTYLISEVQIRIIAGDGFLVLLGGLAEHKPIHYHGLLSTYVL